MPLFEVMEKEHSLEGKMCEEIVLQNLTTSASKFEMKNDKTRYFFEGQLNK